MKLICQSCKKPIGAGHFYSQVWLEVGGDKAAWHLDCDHPKEYPLAMVYDYEEGDAARQAQSDDPPKDPSCPQIQAAENEGLRPNSGMP